MTYTEGNVLIIEYMRGTKEIWKSTSKVTSKSEELLWQNCELKQVNGCSVGFPNTNAPDGFYVLEQYIHKDWNQIIPVVKKVQKELWGNEKIKYPDTYIYNALHTAVSELEIEAIWKRLVEAITLLNKIKK